MYNNLTVRGRCVCFQREQEAVCLEPGQPACYPWPSVCGSSAGSWHGLLKSYRCLGQPACYPRPPSVFPSASCWHGLLNSYLPWPVCQLSVGKSMLLICELMAWPSEQLRYLGCPACYPCPLDSRYGTASCSLHTCGHTTLPSEKLPVVPEPRTLQTSFTLSPLLFLWAPLFLAARYRYRYLYLLYRSRYRVGLSKYQKLPIVAIQLWAVIVHL